MPIIRLRKVAYSLGLLVGLLLLMPSLQAQRIWEEDVVYLHNGSELRGKITEHKIGESITIKVASGASFTYPTSQIEKIARQPAKYSFIKLQLHKAFRPVIYRSRGFYYQFSMNFAMNETQNEPDIRTHFQYRISYHLHHMLNLGLGSGIDTYEGGLILPLYLDLHGDLTRSQVSPHYYLQAGYGFGAGGSQNHDVFRGGYLGEAGAGLTFHTRHNGEWAVRLGLKFQQTYQEFREWPDFIWGRPGGGQIREPALVRGHRRYQKIVLGLTYAFR